MGNELERRGDPQVELPVAPSLLRRRIGLEVEERTQEFRTRHRVDGDVVHFGHEGDLAVFEPFDHPYLPQRSIAVQLPAGDVRGKVGQLAHTAGRGEGCPLYMVVDIELGVVHPGGLPQTERDLDQPPLEHGEKRDPLHNPLADPPEGVAPRHGGGVEDGHDHDVHVDGRRLHVEEAGVLAGQSFRGHRLLLCPSGVFGQLHRHGEGVAVDQQQLFHPSGIDQVALCRVHRGQALRGAGHDEAPHLGAHGPFLGRFGAANGGEDLGGHGENGGVPVVVRTELGERRPRGAMDRTRLPPPPYLFGDEGKERGEEAQLHGKGQRQGGAGRVGRRPPLRSLPRRRPAS